jgi:hypothetical protein
LRKILYDGKEKDDRSGFIASFVYPIRLCGETDTGQNCTGGLFGFMAAPFLSRGKNPG